MALKTGILIIGSLYWDENVSHFHDAQGHCQEYCRKSWRERRLNMRDSRDVDVRIRYGRSSSTRGDTYTMVFSPSAKPGQAKVIRCLNDVDVPQDLVTEAEELWTAECNGKNSRRLVSSTWGCVGLLVNPNRINNTEQLLEAWRIRVSNQAERTNYINFTYPEREKKPVITAAGLLDIDWPKLSNGKDLDCDLLLATANYPFERNTEQSKKYPPTAKKIGESWRKRPYYVNYFYSNCMHGIWTFQDNDIATILCPIR